MKTENLSRILIENIIVHSVYLKRKVQVDLYLPRDIDTSNLSLLLINDGQDMKKLGLSEILDNLINEQKSISPLLCVGIHCAPDRRMEYGVSGTTDYKGRGAKAGLYTSFITKELLPLIEKKYPGGFQQKAFAGFSLGGLMALDIVWNHPDIFNAAAVFSGSLWWRTIDQHSLEYNDDKHRIMHQQVRNGIFHPGLKFFFQCGNMDETKDRNHNGIIDSIDDTRDLIKELINKGYDAEKDIFYLELADGRHDVPTWGRAMPVFLKWSFHK